MNNDTQPEKAASLNGVFELEEFLKKQLGRDDVKILGFKPENEEYIDLKGDNNAKG